MSDKLESVVEVQINCKIRRGKKIHHIRSKNDAEKERKEEGELFAIRFISVTFAELRFKMGPMSCTLMKMNPP